MLSYSKMLAERTASRNVLVLFYLFIYTSCHNTVECTLQSTHLWHLRNYCIQPVCLDTAASGDAFDAVMQRGLRRARL